MEERLERIENKLDMLIKLVSEDVKANCGKMGEHIDFIETVYENVKNPLGYICGKINYLSGNLPLLKPETAHTHIRHKTPCENDTDKIKELIDKAVEEKLNIK